jgi:scytalone dehydratase
MPAEDFVAMASDPNVLGDPLLMTQHFIGGSRWEKVSDTEVIGYHQLRVPHQRYTDATRTKVAIKGHAHSHNTHWYRKVEGVWKFAGLCPDIRWGEYDFDRVFESGRENFGDEQAAEAESTHAAGVPTEAPAVVAEAEKPAVAAAAVVDMVDAPSSSAVAAAAPVEAPVAPVVEAAVPVPVEVTPQRTPSPGLWQPPAVEQVIEQQSFQLAPIAT